MHAYGQRDGYAVSQMLPLTAKANGVDGKLQVLTDSRFNRELKQQMWGNGDWAFILPDSDPRHASFATKPPKPAELRIVTNANHVLQSIPLEQPLAKVTEVQVLAGHTSFLVSVDYSVGFGSYAGVTTSLLDIADSQFKWAEAADVNTKRVERIQLPRTLKTAWKLLPFRGSHDILLVSCRPTFRDNEFVIGYVRYRFNGKQWIEYKRLRKGIWESDEPFPPASKFPQ